MANPNETPTPYTTRDQLAQRITTMLDSLSHRIGNGIHDTIDWGAVADYSEIARRLGEIDDFVSSIERQLADAPTR